MRRLTLITIAIIILIPVLGCSRSEKLIKGKFVFTSSRRQGGSLFIMRDKKVIPLGLGYESGVWSNNGKYIVAAGMGKLNDTITIFDENGKKIQEISDLPDPADVAWSPDDKKIVYSGVGPGLHFVKGKFAPPYKYIYIYDLEKKTNTIIYEGDDKDSFMNLSFSPRGDKLVFRSQRDDDKEGVYTINIDGTNLKKIGSSDATNPSWFPDGEYLMIIMSKDDEGKYINPDEKPSYYKVDAETGEVVEELMHEPIGIGFTSRLTRDGKYIITDQQLGGGRIIVIIPLEGKYKHQKIPIYPKDQFGYDISPDWYLGTEPGRDVQYLVKKHGTIEPQVITRFYFPARKE